MLKKPLCRFLSLIGLFVLFSCQSEVEEQRYNKQETVTKASPITSYLQRLSMVNTVEDNFIDNFNYATIKLPYSLNVDNISIAINSTADYQKVRDLLNLNANAVVKINFPVRLKFYNYAEKLISNQAEYDSLLAFWKGNPEKISKINCLNISYPISFKIYNASNQNASSIEISDDQTLFNFIENLDESQFIKISYPFVLIDGNNQIISIANNYQLENIIKNALDNCSQNSNSTLDFVTVLTADSWKLSFYYADKVKTPLYIGYVFVFKSDKTVTATKLGIVSYGQWSTKLEKGQREFKMNFGSSLLHQLDEDWKLFEFNNSQIRFRKEEGNNDNHYLYFEKN